MATDSYWRVTLDGVTLSGGPADEVPGETEEAVGCLTSPPEGLGMSELRTEDVTYPQRDGARHFSDWYNARIVTLTDVTVCGDDGCASCPSAKVKAREIDSVWHRRCEDTELVIYTDCHGTDEDRSIVGPFGIIGRPRVAERIWNGVSGCATMTLRFDAADQRIYVLDPDGVPGSGGQCVELYPEGTSACRTYDRCYDTGDTTDSFLTNRSFEDGTIEPWVTFAPVEMTLLSAADTPVGSYSPGPTDGDHYVQLIRPVGTDTGQLVTLAQYDIAYDANTLSAAAAIDLAGTPGTVAAVRLTPYTEGGPDETRAIIGEAILTGATVTTVTTDSLVVAEGDLGYHFEVLTDATAAEQPQVEVFADNAFATVESSTSGEGSDGWCYSSGDQEGEDESWAEVDVGGSVCVHPVITLHGTLTEPFLENVDTGDKIGYEGTIGPVETVTFDTDDGTASSAGGNVTYRITGNPQFAIGPGPTRIRLQTYSPDDDGWAEICWRPTVEAI